MENVAYRGFSAVTPENTITAYRRAVEAGCHRISAELRLSADGRPFCYAHPSLQRLTGTHGWLHRVGAEEIRRRPVRFRGNVFRVEHIPELAELLALAREAGMKLVLTLPCGTSPRWRQFIEPTARAVLAALESWRGAVELLLAAGDRRMLQRLLDQDAWPVAAAVDRYADGLALLEDPRLAGLLLDRQLFIPPRRRRSPDRFQQAGVDLLETCRRRGRPCFIGPVQKRAELEPLAALGPDGLITPHTAQLAALGYRREP